MIIEPEPDHLFQVTIRHCIMRSYNSFENIKRVILKQQVYYKNYLKIQPESTIEGYSSYRRYIKDMRLKYLCIIFLPILILYSSTRMMGN